MIRLWTSIDGFVLRVLLCALLAGCGAVRLTAQPPRVMLVLQTGERVSATLKRATASDLVVDVDGVEQTIPLVSVAQMIFSPRGSGQMESAFKAFSVFQDALAAGNVLAADYKDLFATLPEECWIRDRRRRMGRHPDGMSAALEEYRLAGEKEKWNDRLDHWTRADHNLHWARELHENVEGERAHLENPAARPLQIGRRVTGRLDHGDWQMPNGLDGKTKGAFNDRWTIDVRGRTRLLIEMSSTTVTPHLVLVDAHGHRVERQNAQFGSVAIRRRVPAGTYRILAGASGPRNAGTYTLQVAILQ